MMWSCWEIIALLVTLSPAALASSFTAGEHEAFEAICMDLLDLPPAHRLQIQNHHYPDDSFGHRHVYCLGVLTGFFDPTLQHLNVEQLFGQFGSDLSLKQFSDQSGQCERRAKEATENRFEQAFRMFQCFEKEYVKIFRKANSAKLTCEQLEDAERVCMEMFEVSPATRKLFRRQRYLHNDVSKRHMFCTVLVAGIYSERDDMDMDKLYSMFHKGDESSKQFVTRSEKCFKRMGAYEEGISNGEKMFRIYQCYAEEYEAFMDC